METPSAVRMVRVTGVDHWWDMTETADEWKLDAAQMRVFDDWGAHGCDVLRWLVGSRPVTATTSKLVYTLVYDNSMLPDDAARERDKMQRTTQFTRALQNMKTLAEGGTLPPPPPRGGAAGAPAAGGRQN